MICYDCMNAILKRKFPFFATTSIEDLLDADDKCIETGNVSFQGVWSFLNTKYTDKILFKTLHEAFEDWVFCFTDHVDVRRQTKIWHAFDYKTIPHCFCQKEFLRMNVSNLKG